jgi:hypothetical protein
VDILFDDMAFRERELVSRIKPVIPAAVRDAINEFPLGRIRFLNAAIWDIHRAGDDEIKRVIRGGIVNRLCDAQDGRVQILTAVKEERLVKAVSPGAPSTLSWWVFSHAGLVNGRMQL